MKIINFLIEIRELLRDWYLEEMAARYGEVDGPIGASFDEIKQLYIKRK